MGKPNKECGACGEREKTIQLKDDRGEVFARICYCPHCRAYYDGEL